MKKIVLASVAALALSSCGTSYTFEANPSGGDAENGWKGNPATIKCFVIEADSSMGDDDDRQLGEFCKTSNPSGAAQDDMDNEVEEDD